MRLLALIAVCLSFAGCEANTTATSNALAPSNLYGDWQLTTANGGEPSALNIGEYIATFSDDGTWQYRSNMVGTYAGMTLEGSGDWKLDGKVLHYTAGDNSGTCNVSLSNGALAFSEDPVLVDTQQNPIPTEYKR